MWGLLLLTHNPLLQWRVHLEPYQHRVQFCPESKWMLFHEGKWPILYQSFTGDTTSSRQSLNLKISDKLPDEPTELLHSLQVTCSLLVPVIYLLFGSEHLLIMIMVAKFQIKMTLSRRFNQKSHHWGFFLKKSQTNIKGVKRIGLISSPLTIRILYRWKDVCPIQFTKTVRCNSCRHGTQPLKT